MSLEVVEYREKKTESGLLIEKSVICLVCDQYFKIVWNDHKLFSFGRITIDKKSISKPGQISQGTMSQIHTLMVEGMNRIVKHMQRQKFNGSVASTGITENIKSGKKSKMIELVEEQRKKMLIAMREKVVWRNIP